MEREKQELYNQVANTLRTQNAFVKAMSTSRVDKQDLALAKQFETKSGKIIFSQQCWPKLVEIMQTIETQRQIKRVIEIGYLCYGEQQSNGDTVVQDIFIDKKPYEANMANPDILSSFTVPSEEEQEHYQGLTRFLDTDEAKLAHLQRRTHPVIIVGHTHPDLSPVYGKNTIHSSGVNNSLSDVAGLVSRTVEFADKMPNVVYKEMLMNSAADINITSFDTESGKFYKHPNVLAYNPDNKLVPLASFSERPDYTPEYFGLPSWSR